MSAIVTRVLAQKPSNKAPHMPALFGLNFGASEQFLPPEKAKLFKDTQERHADELWFEPRVTRLFKSEREAYDEFVPSLLYLAFDSCPDLVRNPYVLSYVVQGAAIAELQGEYVIPPEKPQKYWGGWIEHLLWEELHAASTQRGSVNMHRETLGFLLRAFIPRQATAYLVRGMESQVQRIGFLKRDIVAYLQSDFVNHWTIHIATMGLLIAREIGMRGNLIAVGDPMNPVDALPEEHREPHFQKEIIETGRACFASLSEDAKEDMQRIAARMPAMRDIVREYGLEQLPYYPSLALKKRR